MPKKTPKQKKAKPSTTKKMNFQKEYNKLQTITEEFEDGEYDVEEGLKKFEEGLKIAQSLQQHLEEVENSIEEIKSRYDQSDESSPKGTKE